MRGRKPGHSRRLEGLTERINQLVYESEESPCAIAEAIIKHDKFPSRAMFCRWRNKGEQPSAYYLARICEYFNVSADWLLGLSDKRKRI